LKDLNGKPDKLLVVEDQRIAQLAMSTEIAWEHMNQALNSDMAEEVEEQLMIIDMDLIWWTRRLWKGQCIEELWYS
jgi:hypothetical protein